MGGHSRKNLGRGRARSRGGVDIIHRPKKAKERVGGGGGAGRLGNKVPWSSRGGKRDRGGSLDPSVTP